jgi:hypothetical protein
MSNLKIKIGKHTNDVEILLDGKNIAGELLIKSLTIGPLVPSMPTTATLEVYCEAEIEILPEEVTVNVDSGEHLSTKRKNK